MNEAFTRRLQQAFEFASMAEIARQIDVPHATIRNYFQGRMPAPEVLIKIAGRTNVSLNWLLTGSGSMFASVSHSFDLDRILEERIKHIVSGVLAERGLIAVEDLGQIDERPTFDIGRAIEKYADPFVVMNEWFKFEGRDFPADFGVVFFQGWESFSDEERLEALRDAKKVLDRTLNAGGKDKH